MNTENKIVVLKPNADSVQSGAPKTVTVYRFDLFKGTKDSTGKILKVKSVGSAYIREGLRTYTVHLKALLNNTFYLLPNTKPTTTDADFVILTRELAQNSGRKYFWNNVGEGRFMDHENKDLMHLSWDVFMADDIYMTTHPINVSELPDALKFTSEAA